MQRFDSQDCAYAHAQVERREIKHKTLSYEIFAVHKRHGTKKVHKTKLSSANVHRAKLSKQQEQGS